MSTGPTHLTTHPIHPAPAVDGAQHPEQIPDSVAWRLFLKAVCEPLDGSPEQQRRLAAKVGRAHLRPADFASFRQIVGQFQTKHADWRKRYLNAIEDARKYKLFLDHETFRTELAEIVSRTTAALETSLSAEGFTGLRGFLQKEKSRIKIYSYPLM